jgi:hypothetical protein
VAQAGEKVQDGDEDESGQIARCVCLAPERKEGR